MHTDNSRWERLHALFTAAMDLPAKAQEAFIKEHCGEDQELTAELHKLLAADRKLDRGKQASQKQQAPSSSVLTRVIHATMDEALEKSLEEIEENYRSRLIGTQVGAYRLISVLGHGGAGTVYLAERVDQQYSAQVAVKIVSSTLFRADLSRRFRAERQILANLNHPFIARLLDAGELEAGQPYLVMEYVQGLPIDQYCDTQQLSLQERLQLFLKVCSAVQYAHQNLIVHRDLKPANILVTVDGTPKLLDFGIAKLLTQSTDPVNMALTMTQVHDRVLTPEYASPEQIMGLQITTASDVYTLGVVLFELLTGLRPYHLKAMNQSELERTIVNKNPRRPSALLQRTQRTAFFKAAHTTPPPLKQLEKIAQARQLLLKNLSKHLRGDLDAITLRALRKEPNKRYSSVEQLAEDIERYIFYGHAAQKA